MKVCSRCQEPKELVEFNRRKESKDGRTPNCKPCIKLRRQEVKLQGAIRTFPHATDHLTSDQKKTMYSDVILRMKAQGLTSDKTTDEMLARVGGM